MPVRIRKRKRVIRSLKENVVLTKAEEKPVYSNPTTRVMRLVEYSRVLAALRGGVSVPQIVKWFENEGWLEDLSPSTFTQYLYKFKSERSELIRVQPSAVESYDFHVGTHIPDVDEEKELDKLILIQKRRLSMEISTEIGLGKLLDGTHKEMNVMNELLRSKRNFRNGDDEDLNVGSDSAALRTLRVNEGEQDQMQSLADQLIRSIKDAKVSTGKKQTVKARA